MLRCLIVFQAVNTAKNWLWDSLFGYHVIQLMLFFGRYIPFINVWTGRFAAWLASSPSVGINDNWRIHNVDCRVCVSHSSINIPKTYE
jgi:L-gulonolactone oxidase